MKGFFSKEETQSVNRPDGKIYSCVRCKLIKTAHTPKMKPYGRFKKGILIVNDFPSEKDDKIGKPLHSADGLFLKKQLEHLGIDLWEDCMVTNAINCCPGESLPTTYQNACCRTSLLKTIEQYMPKLIILLGTGPVVSLIGHRWKRDIGKIAKWRGWVIPDQDLKCWIAPVYHPQFVRGADKQEVVTIFQQDLERVISKGLSKFKKRPPVKIDIIGPQDLDVLYDIKNGDLSAVDFETTGLKPHAPGHRIISAAVTTSEKHAYAFMMPSKKSQRRPLLDYFQNPAIIKIAQNMKFEHAWCISRLKVIVNGWGWDTMLATHMLDNRPDITSLKFQTYVQFGIVDYDSEISPYLKSIDPADGNSLNRIHELIATKEGADKLLTYNGYDSIWEHQLALLQTNLINYDFLPF